MGCGKIAIILNCYPQTSETFIAQELLGLQRTGLAFDIISLERPKNLKRSSLNDAIRADVHYVPLSVVALPRVFRAWHRVRGLPGYKTALRNLLRDLARTANPLLIDKFARALIVCDRYFEHRCPRPRPFHQPARGRCKICRFHHVWFMELLGARKGHLDAIEIGPDCNARRFKMDGHLLQAWIRTAEVTVAQT